MGEEVKTPKDSERYMAAPPPPPNAPGAPAPPAPQQPLRLRSGSTCTCSCSTAPLQLLQPPAALLLLLPLHGTRVVLKLESVSCCWTNFTSNLSEVQKVIIGKAHVIDNVMINILSNGNLLFEDYPGLAKTLMTNTFADALGCDFKRVQFTPDLLPADITGTNIYDAKKGEFTFKPGPIFCNSTTF